jgi:translation machinery-associated protein 16
MVTEEKEYDAGFWIPDMADEGNLKMLREWNGEWTSLNTFKYVRLSRGGSIQPSNFPPKGLS